MNVPELFIRRPVMTTLVMAGILIFGFMGYRALPVSDLPNVDVPTIQVTARLPGASPDETMASSVATPLEKQFSTIAGIDNMTSSSVQGAARITMQFALERNITKKNHPGMRCEHIPPRTWQSLARFLKRCVWEKLSPRLSVATLFPMAAISASTCWWQSTGS